jgi:hypothetical protein
MYNWNLLNRGHAADQVMREHPLSVRAGRHASMPKQETSMKINTNQPPVIPQPAPERREEFKNTPRPKPR